ncbi:MAG: Lipid export ATP-binding/permease protein MsbA, partial [Cyanobacteria bacterium RYN_339]|nr:Lipid export ATP-binding/permease protein MsbA [Cyanobacteria bacterium RYN_339]
QSGKPRGPLRRLMTYLGAHRLATAGTFASILITLAANLATPLFIRSAVDEGVGHHDQQALWLALGCLVGAALLRGLFGYLQVYLAERTSQHVAFKLRGDLFEKVQRLSFSYYDQTESGQLLTRLTNDVDQVRTFFASGLAQVVQSAIMLVASVVLIVTLDWKLALLTLVSLVPIVLVLGRFTKVIRPMFMQVMMHMSRMNTVLRETLAGVRMVRAFGREAHEAGRYNAVNAQLLDQTILTTRAGSNTFPAIFFFSSLGTLVIVGFGGWEVMNDRLTLGTLLAFTSYLGFLLQPLMMLGFSAMLIARASASATRIVEIMDAPLDVTDKPDAVVLPPIQGEVVFDEVSFRYPGGEADVLSGVAFTVKPGETVAIVGMTGSGKSTLAHLLPRFYDVTKGAVRLDGHDVRDLTLGSLRGGMAIVLQEPLLFSGTVADNIAYGNPAATRAAVEQAARDAQAHDFISELPDGYDTVIGERGVGLSGGQRQRVAIARALLVNPRLIVLDDSTSAVDTQTERAIQGALDRLMREANRTCLVIAHRFSTLRDADRILVLDKGKLVGQGSHAELMRTNAVYQDIVGTQFSAGRSA